MADIAKLKADAVKAGRRAFHEWKGKEQPGEKERLLCAFEAYEAAKEAWRPIETAPKDGSTILIYGLPQGKETMRFLRPAVYTAAWDLIDQAFCISGGDWTGPFVEPTHWMPKPPPPRATE